MKRFKTWISSLFENEPKRKKYKRLTKYDVKRCENFMKSYNIDTTCEYFDISRGTYFAIKKGKHSQQRKK